MKKLLPGSKNGNQKTEIRILGFYFSFTLILASLFIILNLSPKALAQGLPVQTFTVTPPSVSIQGDPGYQGSGTMGVINDSDVPLTFKAEMHDFIVTDTIGTPEILPPNSLMDTYSAAAWIGVSPETFTIQPKQRQDLNYYIQIPKNARPGGHYAAVVFVPVQPKDNNQNTGATVNGQIGTLFSIAVNGPIKESASVSKFLVTPFQEYGPVTIQTQIKNFGDLHITPKGYITVSDMLGRQAVLPLDEHNIFPMAARDYQNTFGTHWMFGRYKVQLTASYGVNNNLPLMATVYFWVFPWKVTVVIVLILIALILGLLYVKKNGLKLPKKKNVSEPKEETPQPSEVK